VLVSTARIQNGASADAIATQHLYKVEPVLASQVSAGAIVNAGSIVGKVAADTILPGEQLTAADFTTAPTAVGVSAVLAPTERAVAVTLDSAHAVADVLEAGDQVDVYGSFDSVVSLLVPDALVLKPPATASGGSGGTVLLETSMQLTPRIMWMFDNGKVWLELRGVNATNPAPTITGSKQVLLGNHLTTTPTYTTPATTGTKP
jgi:Flp pilus assembly protein CpaB